MEQNFDSKTVNQLQSYLKARGVSVTNKRKYELIQLCKVACEMDIELDPDGIQEDKLKTKQSKLCFKDGTNLKDPGTLDGVNDLSILPYIGIVDLYDHLRSIHSCENMKVLKQWNKTEGFQMHKDGYVIDVVIGQYEENENCCFIKGKVKPRTNDKDPISKLPFYKTWVIVNKDAPKNILKSAFCSCKGG